MSAVLAIIEPATGYVPGQNRATNGNGWCVQMLEPTGWTPRSAIRPWYADADAMLPVFQRREPDREFRVYESLEIKLVQVEQSPCDEFRKMTASVWGYSAQPAEHLPHDEWMAHWGAKGWGHRP